MEGIETISKNLDLVYSPDDGGWYFQRYFPKVGNQCSYDEESEIYKTKEIAMLAFRNNWIVWGEG